MKALWCAGHQLWVDDAITEMALPRVHVAAFTVDPVTEPPLVRLRLTPGLEGQRVQAPMGTATVLLTGDTLEVDIAQGPFLGELALRLAYAVATHRLGGVLVHASAVGLGDVALVASGVSGAGKSTLARHAVAAGATLLSDEIVQLLPDGRVGGTPFRSDTDRPSTPRLARGELLVGLRKATAEALEPLGPAQATLLAMSQCFEAPVVPTTRVESRQRLLEFLSHVELATLACRNDPAVGGFVCQLLARRST